MKRLLLGMLTVVLLFGMSVPQALAMEPTATTTTPPVVTEVPVVAAGITPDSWFYGFDRALEQLTLFLAQGEVAKAALLEKLAAERLSEAEQMLTTEQQALAQQMVTDFTTTMKAITENLETAMLKTGSTVDSAKLAEVVASVQALREGFQVRVNEVLTKLDQQLPDDPNDAIDDADETADAAAKIEDDDDDDHDGQLAIQNAIIKAYGLDEKVFEELAKAGLNFGQSKMMAILIGRANQGLAADADKLTVAEALAMRTKGWGQLKKEVGLKAGDFGLAVGHILRAANGDAEDEDEDEDEKPAVIGTASTTTLTATSVEQQKNHSDKEQRSDDDDEKEERHSSNSKKDR